MVKNTMIKQKIEKISAKKRFEAVLATLFMAATSLFAGVLISLVLLTWTPAQVQAHPARAVQGIVYALPDEARDDFKNKMKQQRELWNADAKDMHKESKTMLRQLVAALQTNPFDPQKADILLKGMQDGMSRRGVKAMDRMRGTFVEVLGSLSPKERREIVSELKEALDDYEDYNPHRRWWHSLLFWRD